jgi:release factor glutamine methyltransferase
VTPPTLRCAGARVGGLLRQAGQRLRDAGLATARQDAELLLARVLSTSRLAIQVEPDREIDPVALAGFERLLARRAGHEPLQYLLGVEEFMGLRIRVGPGVFIPRPETELLVERALACLPGTPGLVALDLCAGAGGVACAMAARRRDLFVWAVERSPRAARFARTNVDDLGLAARVHLLEGDLFTPLTGLDLAGRCDAVVANPPYLARPTLATLPPEVRDWEPAPALDGGPDGLAVVARILAEAPRFARPGGRVLLEIGHDQAERLRRRLAADPRYERPVFHRDLAGHERVLEAGVR